MTHYTNEEERVNPGADRRVWTLHGSDGEPGAARPTIMVDGPRLGDGDQVRVVAAPAGARAAIPATNHKPVTLYRDPFGDGWRKAVDGRHAAALHAAGVEMEQVVPAVALQEALEALRRIEHGAPRLDRLTPGTEHHADMFYEADTLRGFAREALSALAPYTESEES